MVRVRKKDRTVTAGREHTWPDMKAMMVQAGVNVLQLSRSKHARKHAVGPSHYGRLSNKKYEQKTLPVTACPIKWIQARILLAIKQHVR